MHCSADTEVKQTRLNFVREIDGYLSGISLIVPQTIEVLSQIRTKEYIIIEYNK